MHANLFRSQRTGLWTPESFKDPKHEAYLLKRVTDIDVALRYAKKTSVAVQAGGYVGLWPLRLAKSFSLVHTFEPLDDNFDALAKNIETTPGIVAHKDLLGAVNGAKVTFAIRKGWGSRITDHDPNAEKYVERTTTTIDALELPCCDAIFLDVEGAELLAIEGAKETIRQFRPVITLEGWDGNVDQYRAFMDKLDYDLVTKVHMDMIFRPR